MLEQDLYAKTVDAFQSKHQKWTCDLLNIHRDGCLLMERVYAHRSCCKAIPQAQADLDADHASRLKRVTNQVLKPVVRIIRELNQFRETSVDTVVDILSATSLAIKNAKLSAGLDLFVMEPYLEALAKLLHLFAGLDAIKDVKGGMKNDFSLYKRTLSEESAELRKEHQSLSFFLGHSDQFCGTLKKLLQNHVPRYEIILIHLIEAGCSAVSMPDPYASKDTWLKAISVAICLVDGNTNDSDITLRKDFKTALVLRLLKANPVVCFLPDAYTDLRAIYRKSIHFVAAADRDASATAKTGLNLTGQMEQLNSDYGTFTATLDVILFEIAHVRESKLLRVTPEIGEALYNVAVNGLKLVNRCRDLIFNHLAHKLLSPAKRGVDGVPDDVEEYELAIRYNLSSEDKTALAQAISIAKSTVFEFKNLDPHLNQLLENTIQFRMHRLLATTVTDALEHARKRGKAVQKVLQMARDLGSDLCERTAAETWNLLLDGRCPVFSMPQLESLRLLLEICVSEKTIGMKQGFFHERDLKATHIAEIRAFLIDAREYVQVLDLKKTTLTCSNFSNLWFKEFYRDLSDQPQFSIRASLPWILAEHVLKSDNPDLKRCLLFPFEIYNDCFDRVLDEMRSAHLYHELAAEAQTGFNMLMELLAEKLYGHFKCTAALYFLPPEYSKEPDSFYRLNPNIPISAYAAVLSCQNYKLLDQTINLSTLFAKLFVKHFETNIIVLTQQLRVKGLDRILEMHAQLRIMKKTYHLMSEYVPFDVSFEAVLESVDWETGESQVMECTVGHLVEMMRTRSYDSSLNAWSLDPERREHSHPHESRVPHMYQFGSRALNHAFRREMLKTRPCIDLRHFSALRAIITSFRLTLDLVEKALSTRLTQHVVESLTIQMEALHSILPKHMKMPSFEIGSAGVFDYFKSNLEFALLSGDRILCSLLMQSLKEIGNGVLIMKHLTETVNIPDARIECFLEKRGGLVGMLNSLDLPSYEHVQRRSEIILALESRLPADFKSSSLLATFLSKLKLGLMTANSDSSVVVGSMDLNSRAFYRIWCCIQFASAVKDANFSKKHSFGAEVDWAGETILHLLGQVHHARVFSFNNHMLSVLRAEASGLRATLKSHVDKWVHRGAVLLADESTLESHVLVFVEAAIAKGKLEEEVAFALKSVLRQLV
ncbi:cytoplasmic fragile-X interacting family-domain-containing protein [Chytriomyces cf. hyalinus JEL632]|nr:cytoplasmic fragile-X interacting family-domain-containing protein [Chytriomyces cf. hyalinus JEL632]